ncbi:Ig-like domain-containing protein [Streptomyces sp. NPDC006430]|uniref:Ig-like domain-containing protein n=1 Tax=Streptomyces sp. NPDC006430 TaxID=3154299 RepID=UPI0033B695F2
MATTAALAVMAFASPAAAAVPSTTTVQASPSTVTAGQSVDLTATVTCAGDPSGGLGMTFYDGAAVLTTVPVGANGTSAYTANFTSTGSHTITAAYNGNDNCNASNNTTKIEVSAAPAPPTTPGMCLLCNGLINFTVSNIHNEVNVR